MTTDSTSVPAETLDNALDAVRVAVSLGMPVDAVEGVVVYEAIVHAGGRGPDWNVPRATFASRETAQGKVAEEILDQWWNQDFMPWEDRTMGERDSDDMDAYDSLFEGWAAGKTTAEILEACATGCGEVGYTIRPIVLQ